MKIQANQKMLSQRAYTTKINKTNNRK